MKTFILFIPIILTCLFTKAQSPDWQWAKQATGGSSWGTGIITDATGNVYACGVNSGDTLMLGTNILIGDNGDNIFLAKYDATGKLLWAKGAQATMHYGIATDANGNIYVTGIFAGPAATFGNIKLTNPDQYTYNFFIAKYDPEGNVVWAKNYGGAENDFGYGIALDPNGNIFVTGGFSGPSLTIGSFKLTTGDPDNDGSDAFIAEFDNNGNIQWLKGGKGDGWDQGLNIAADANGNAYVLGYFNGGQILLNSTLVYNTDSVSYTKRENIFVAKYDHSGNLLWVKTDRGAFGAMDIRTGIAADVAGNVYISGGYFSDTAFFNNDTLINANGNIGNDNIFIAKYNSSGDLKWAKSIGGPSENSSTDLIIDRDNYVYISGYFTSSIAFGNNILNGPRGIFIAKYDSMGGAMWAKQAVQNKIMLNNQDLACDAAGNLFLTGTFISTPFILGKDTLRNVDSTFGDFFIASLNQTGTGISEETAPSSTINVYPNPGNGIFTINEYNEKPFAQLLITNLLGELIYSSAINSGKTQIDISIQPKGIYFYRLQNSDKTWQSGKIIIE